MKRTLTLAVLAVALLLGAFATATPSEAAAKCPRTGIYCLDVWDPVLCDDGKVYSNACYAYVACATGCGPVNM